MSLPLLDEVKQILLELMQRRLIDVHHVSGRVMIHDDSLTTLAHYTVLGLTDTARAVAELPGVGSPDTQRERATGTADSCPTMPTTKHPIPQLLARQMVQSGATQCVGEEHVSDDSVARNSPSDATLRDAVRPRTTKRATGVEPATFSLEG